MRAGTRVCAWYCVRISPPARTPVNGYAAESVNGQSVVKEEPSMNEGVSDLYTSVADTHRPICSRRQQSAAAAVAIDVSYLHLVHLVVWQPNSLL